MATESLSEKSAVGRDGRGPSWSSTVARADTGGIGQGNGWQAAPRPRPEPDRSTSRTDPESADTATPLTHADAVLTDLDGVIYRGEHAIPHAIAALNACAPARSVGYVTNNASRPPARIAAQLRNLGLTVDESGVITSSQVATQLLRDTVQTGAAVLVVGGEGLVGPVSAAGFRVVHTAAERPQAVIQGFAPEVGWRELAEAALALAPAAGHAPLPWIATNRDLTIPLAAGIAPGNGTLVAAVATATGREPISAGKPEPAIYQAAAVRLGAKRPLFIGDRLDTDIRGARNAAFVSAFVLTGVSTPLDLLRAPASDRPDFILTDLRQLHEPYPQPHFRERDGAWDVAGSIARVDLAARTLQLIAPGTDPINLLRAAAAAIWAAPLDPAPLTIPPQLLGPELGLGLC